MELIEGPTLGAWLEGQSRPWREVVRAFVDAGRGLAEAHAAGLTHRDFKPGNVLVDVARNRFCVTDFGLAAPIPPLAEEARSTHQSQSGCIGTPAYMAPEQYRGEPADPRTDQFSFCVALYEGLYGQAPFDGETWEAREAAIRQGALRAPPPGARVPAWVHRIVRRGLSLEPGDRYPSMEALLRDLSPRRRTRPALALGLLASVLALGISGVAGLAHVRAHQAGARPMMALCSSSEDRLAQVWDGGRRQRIEQAIRATNKPYVADAWRGTERALDAYAGDWAKRYASACGALAATATPDPASLHRMACVEDGLMELRALTDMLEHSNADIVANAALASESLSPLAHCDDEANGAAVRVVAPPAPSVAAEVLAVRMDVARVKALHRAQRRADARPLGAQAVAAARATGYRPLIAQALLQYGYALVPMAAEATYREAAQIADAVGDDRTRALALIALTRSTAAKENYERADELERQAVSAVERLGRDPAVELALRWNLGVVAETRGDLAKARAQAERALTLSEEVHGPGHWWTAMMLSMLARVMSAQGDLEQALAAEQRALGIALEVAGPENPTLIDARIAMGSVLAELLRSTEAEAQFREALRLADGRGGRIDAHTLSALVGLGSALSDQRRHDEALVVYRRAEHTVHEGEDCASGQWTTLLGLGRAYVGLRRPAEAIDPLERALSLEDARPGKEEEAERDILLAEALRDTGRAPRRVRDLARRAADIYRREGHGPRHDRDRARAEALLRRLAGA
jgi:tetratricopeptide (TPR) repeat protein